MNRKKIYKIPASKAIIYSTKGQTYLPTCDIIHIKKLINHKISKNPFADCMKTTRSKKNLIKQGHG